MSFLWFLVLDASKDSLAINIFAALANDGIADLTDQYYKASRSIVVWRVGPNHENHVHNGNKEVRNFREILAKVGELVK